MEDVDTEQTNEARRLLAAAFETVPADAVMAGDGLLRAVRRRHTRRRRFRALVSAGVSASAVAGTAAVLLSVTAAGASPALAAVTRALSRAAAGSFRMKLVVTEHDTVPAPGGFKSPLQITGELDLKRNLGVETMSNGWRTRIVGGEAYTELPPAQARKMGFSRPWGQTPLWVAKIEKSPYRSAGAQLAWDFNSGWPFNPQALLAVLRSGARMRDEGSVSGPGWTGTRYRFTISHPQDTGGVVDDITCTVDVDSHGYIRELAQVTAFSETGKPGTSAQTIYTADFTFSDFGVRFSVTPPPASQIDRDNGTGIQF
jgi:hypothetical protein